MIHHIDSRAWPHDNSLPHNTTVQRGWVTRVSTRSSPGSCRGSPSCWWRSLGLTGLGAHTCDDGTDATKRVNFAESPPSWSTPVHHERHPHKTSATCMWRTLRHHTSCEPYNINASGLLPAMGLAHVLLVGAPHRFNFPSCCLRSPMRSCSAWMGDVALGDRAHALCARPPYDAEPAAWRATIAPCKAVYCIPDRSRRRVVRDHNLRGNAWQPSSAAPARIRGITGGLQFDG